MTGELDKEQFDPESYPALLEFLPAYLHEDFVEEYGSAEKAFEALVVDATGDQIRNVKDDWRKFRRALSGKPLDRVQKALAALGVAWQPQSGQDLQAVDEILSRSEA
jgi:hypothetical protein